MIPALVPVLPFVAPTTLNDMITQLGSQSSLAFVIDAGDPASAVNSSNQTLGTVPSGSSIAITRGPTSGVDAGNRDPTFVGNIGGQSVNEYWRLDSTAASSAGYFGSGTGQATFDNAHKAGAAFTIAAAVYVASAETVPAFYDDGGGNPATIGMTFGLLSNHPTLLIANGASQILSPSGTGTVARDTPTFVAISYNATSGTLIFQSAGAQQTLTGQTLTGPSASAASFAPLMSVPNGNQTDSCRLYNYAWWNRALSAAELLAIYTAQQPKFGF